MSSVGTPCQPREVERIFQKIIREHKERVLKKDRERSYQRAMEILEKKPIPIV